MSVARAFALVVGVALMLQLLAPSFAAARAVDKKIEKAPTKAQRARLAARTRARIGKPPERVVVLQNGKTNESIVVARTPDVTLPQPVLNDFFRCHFTQATTRVDGRLPSFLVRAAIQFDKDRVNIVSTFRAPKYNLMLRKKGRQVARDSQHSHGNAVDFWLPGVATKVLRDWAWSLALGGVGYYPKSGFVHMDTGPRRKWTGD